MIRAGWARQQLQTSSVWTPWPWQQMCCVLRARALVAGGTTSSRHWVLVSLFGQSKLLQLKAVKMAQSGITSTKNGWNHWFCLASHGSENNASPNPLVTHHSPYQTWPYYLWVCNGLQHFQRHPHGFWRQPHLQHPVRLPHQHPPADWCRAEPLPAAAESGAKPGEAPWSATHGAARSSGGIGWV